MATVIDMSDNLRTYTQALFGFDATVRRAPDDSWNAQSPCEAWKAIDVLAHTIGMNEMVVGFTNGVDAKSPRHEIPADPAAAWRESLDTMLTALDQQGALQEVAKTPWGEMPVDKFLGFAWVDPVIHTWDLAKATGQDPVIDPGLVDRANTQMERAGDSLRGERTFGPAVEAPADADPITRLAAITGRNPAA